jgi:hypothetical protein
MGEDSLLERVTAAAEERQLSHNSLIACHFCRNGGKRKRSDDVE